MGLRKIRRRCRLLHVGLYSLSVLILLFTDRPAIAAADDPGLTIEVSWNPSPTSSFISGSAEISDVVLFTNADCEILDVIALNASSSGSFQTNHFDPSPVQQKDGSWLLGNASTGRFRARLKGSIHTNLFLQVDGTTWPIPLVRLLDAPQRHTTGASSTFFEVRRLPWDSIEVQIPGQGLIEPGNIIPATIGLNLLSPVATEALVTIKATLRPIRAPRIFWEQSHQMVTRTNVPVPPTVGIQIPGPHEPGTYVLEIATSWRLQPGVAEGSRLERWWDWMRNRNVEPEVAVRRVSIVVDDLEPDGPRSRSANVDRHVVDVVDLGRPRGLRPYLSGRKPGAVTSDAETPWAIPSDVLVDSKGRERLWSLLGRVGTDARPMAQAGADGLSWVATPIRILNPDRPHHLELTVLEGNPEAMAVAVIAPGSQPRVLLDARGSGTPIVEGSAVKTYSWPIWPDVSEPVLIVLNRSPNQPLWLGDAIVSEEVEGPALPQAESVARGSNRKLALRFPDMESLERFGGVTDDGLIDADARARHLVDYLESVNASAVVLPMVWSSRSIRTALRGQAVEDAIGPDQRALLFRHLEQHEIGVVVEADLRDVDLPGLPPLRSPKALEEGLIRLDQNGKPENDPSYNLLRPEVRRAFAQYILEAVESLSSTPKSSGIRGILIRLGEGPTLAGRWDMGLDDDTYPRFVGEMIKSGLAPGMNSSSSNRYEVRARFVTESAWIPWIRWRTRITGAFYDELSRSLAEASPGTQLLLATPGLDQGPLGSIVRSFDLRGQSPRDAWRAVGLDFNNWPNTTADHAPVILRTAGSATDDLAHDLARHPDLDTPIRKQPHRGVLLDLGAAEGPRFRPMGANQSPMLRAVPLNGGLRGDELLSHAITAIDSSWVVISAPNVVGQEPRIRSFSEVLEALPAASPTPPELDPTGLFVSTGIRANRGIVTFANATPYAVRVSSVLDVDLERESIEWLGQFPDHPLATGPSVMQDQLTINLPPFGVTSLRVNTPQIKIKSTNQRFDDLRDQHARAVGIRLRQLAAGGAIAELNPGFEPEPTVKQASTTGDLRRIASQTGTDWLVEGTLGASVTIDSQQPYSGRGSLRLEANVGPATAVSPPFLPPGSSATLSASIRTEPADARVRIRIETVPGALNPVQLSTVLRGNDHRAWTRVTRKVPGLPTDGDSRIQLRFELIDPGRLWIDDLSMTGPGLAQARSSLNAALQAFDEQRYADFARLASTHWVRQLGGLPVLSAEVHPRSPIQTREASTGLPGRSRLR